MIDECVCVCVLQCTYGLDDIDIKRDLSAADTAGRQTTHRTAEGARAPKVSIQAFEYCVRVFA